MIKYQDYAYVFSLKLVIEQPKNTSSNKYAIDLIEDKQLPYGPIYILSPIELETLKTYIKTNLKSEFIQTSMSLDRAPIFFDKKSDGSFCLYVNYQGLNNFTIKKRYLLSFVWNFLD